MSTTPTAIPTDQGNTLRRAKSLLGAAMFVLAQRFPKLLQLHRNENSWTLFRVALACFGAALVVLPLSLWHGWITAIFGLLLFVAAILMPPAETESLTDRKASELGAQIVVSGGEYKPGNAPPAEARLFISASSTWALDKHFAPLLVIPTAEVSGLRVQPDGERWTLSVRWADHKAEFSFTGFFAERLARLAEESIRSAAPEIPRATGRSRAASA